MSERDPSVPSTPISLSSSSEASISVFSTPPTPSNLHQNSIDPAAKWLVQKFGGTSVGKFADKIAEDIVSLVFNLVCAGQVAESMSRPRVAVQPCSTVLCALKPFAGNTSTSTTSQSYVLRVRAPPRPSVPQICCSRRPLRRYGGQRARRPLAPSPAPPRQITSQDTSRKAARQMRALDPVTSRRG